MKRTEKEARCTKVAFATLDDAAAAIVNAKIARSLHGSSRRREERAYFCEPCSAWHLTSSPARPASIT